MSGEDLDRKFGLVYFDDEQEPGAGWCAVAGPGGQAARRIMGPNELSTDTLWWTNITYDHFYKRSEAYRNPNLRHDKYLVVSPKDVLREWGYDPEAVDSQFTCSFGAQVFDRIMRISWSLLSYVNPKMRIEEAFTGKTLREDLRSLLPELDYPKGPSATVIKSGNAWEEFTATSVRAPKGARWITLRRPRLSYAMEMLQTPVPRGPFEYKARNDLKGDARGRVQLVKTVSEPCMVEVTIKNMQPEVSPIYNWGAATNKDVRQPRNWVAHPEFILLTSMAEVDVRSVYMGREYWGMVPEMSDGVTEFLNDKVSEFSWSAGIVAECLWRSVPLAEDKAKAGPLRDGEERAQTSWPGAWVRAADKSTLFMLSMRLTELGYAVSSYGLGWVRVSVTEEEVLNLIKDGLGLGLVPSLSEVPEGAFRSARDFNWQGDERAKNLVYFTLMKNREMLWNLDKVPLIPRGRRKEYLRKLHERYRGSVGGQA